MKTDKPAFTNSNIERHRKMLEQAVLKHGLTSTPALMVSESLDKLIIEATIAKMAVPAD